MRITREEKRLDEVTHDDLDGGKVILDAFSGKHRITGINDEWWVYCPDSNCGLGKSFFCSPDTSVVVFHLAQEEL